MNTRNPTYGGWLGHNSPALWQDRGKRGEARDILAPVFEWFTEGFDTPDLIEAKKVLAQLA